MGRKVIFRMDDICPGMRKAPFARMVSILEKYDATAIIGVVPECRDPELNLEDEDPHFWEMIKNLQDKGWTIAMHGCYHEYVTKNNGLISNNKRSEFAGLPYEEQMNKLLIGQRLLAEHGIATDVFMAPSHSYDKNTLKALKQLGFRYITDGLTSKPYEYMGLVFIPCIDAKIRKNNRLMTVCYHTNHSAESRYLETREILINHRNDVIAFSDACLLPRKAHWLARFEECFRWLWKYWVMENAYRVKTLLRI